MIQSSSVAGGASRGHQSNKRAMAADCVSLLLFHTKSIAMMRLRLYFDFVVRTTNFRFKCFHALSRLEPSVVINQNASISDLRMFVCLIGITIAYFFSGIVASMHKMCIPPRSVFFFKNFNLQFHVACYGVTL